MLRVIVAVLCGILFPTLAAGEPRLALVIGNSDYGKDVGHLPNPANDADLIGGALRDVGFTVSVVKNADKAAMTKAIANLGKALVSAGPGSTALFYFAGHGIQFGGVNYLIPVSASIAGEADVAREAIPADAVLKAFEFAGSQVSILILDACRNNPLARTLKIASRGLASGTDPTNASSVAPGLAQMNAPKGTFIAYSTAPGSVATDGVGRNSPFAESLAIEMRKRNVPIEATFRQVRAKVILATGSQQVPWDASSLTAPFSFAGLPVSMATSPEPSSESIPPSSNEALFWMSVKDSRSPMDFEAYLKKYPNGDFADLAKSRIAALRSAGPVAELATPQDGESENPLPDGPIVLSAKVAAQLKEYLDSDGTNQGRPSYFFVSEDGQTAGYFSCPKHCGRIVGSPNTDDKARRKAEASCNSGAKTPCVLLFSLDNEKHPYKIAGQ